MLSAIKDFGQIEKVKGMTVSVSSIVIVIPSISEKREII